MHLHFISGLPRSGSTLLAAILRQNPRFHADMSSPVAPILRAVQEATGANKEYSPFVDDRFKHHLFKGIFHAYHDASDDDVVFDTHRSWCAKMPLLAKLWPESKVICCVRHVPWVLDSVERIIRANPLHLSGMFGHAAGGTVYTRVKTLMATDGMVGFALDALREAYYGAHADRLLVVDYDNLAREPEQILRIIYSFIGEEYFDHDFNNVEYSAEAFDTQMGTPGLHQVRPKVERMHHRTVLPPDLYERYRRHSFWMYPDENTRDVSVVCS